uniref:Protocadherin-16 n=1 Tax=Callorhinchus milii TaxID=7868 RepID=A0A4W3IGZ8_CALMI
RVGCGERVGGERSSIPHRSPSANTHFRVTGKSPLLRPHFRCCFHQQRYDFAKLLFQMVVLFGTSQTGQAYDLSLSVDEGQPPETLVGDISAGLPEGTPSSGYFISESHESLVFRDLHIDAATGIIKTAKVLDRETTERYAFVAVTPTGHVVRVRVRVKDVNDHAPVFPGGTIRLNISEQTPVGVAFRLDGARDPDAGEFGTQGYLITGGNPGTFQLQSRRGASGLGLDLVLLQPLDRETVDSYSLTIEAFDGGTPRRTATARLDIQVLDADDNPPRFGQTEYEAWVREDAAPGTRVLQVHASDPDLGSNGLLTYRIDRDGGGGGAGQAPGPPFSIDAESGVISVSGPLDRERRGVHRLVVRAVERDSPPEAAAAAAAAAFVSLRLLDVNDNAPSLSVMYLGPSGRALVSEGAAPGEPVARISATDPDLGDNGRLLVTLRDEEEDGGGGGGGGRFSLRRVAESVYLLCVSGALDREEREVHRLVLTARDRGSPPLAGRLPLRLRLSDLNDHAPAFPRGHLYRARTAEGVPLGGRALARVRALDPDSGRNGAVRYRVLSEHAHCGAVRAGGGYFRVHPESGDILAADPRLCLDRERQAAFLLVVEARDLGEPPLSSTASVLLLVDDVNDNEPIFERQVYSASVRERVPPGTSVLQVTARDADSGHFGSIQYSLYEGFNNYEESHLFSIDTITGQVCTTQIFDRDNGPPNYDLLVKAEDGGGLSAQAFIHIEVQDINDNKPVFNPLTYITSISKHTPPGTEIINVIAYDRDSGINGQVSYELVPGNFSSFFFVDPSAGAVYLTSDLCHVQVSSLLLMVSAQDGGGLISPINATVTVYILESVLPPTKFKSSHYFFVVAEDIPIHSSVGIVQTTNSPENIFRISSGDPYGYFSIEPRSGLIKTSRQLDHEAQPSVVLTVQSQMNSSPVYSSTQVNITITDVNDNTPVFHKEYETITISKNTLPGTVIFIAHAEDKDSGSNGIVMYSIQNDYEQMFSIDPKHGTIFLNRSLSSEKQHKYSLNIFASDEGTRSLSAMFMLSVIVDHLDDILIFETLVYQVEISEAAPPDTRIVQVCAYSQDLLTDSVIVYSLQPTLDSVIFDIHADTGWIYTRRSLDYESTLSYTFKVFAINPADQLRLSATTTVTVSVTDENDSPPKFTQDFYFFTIEESQVPHGLIGKVKATDQDSGKNSEIAYILLSDGKYFRLNSKTGEIINWIALDREQQTQHQMSILVRDHGVPQRNASTTVYITVTDINDNPPLFSYPESESEITVKVLEAQPEGTFLTTLFAKDPDAGENGTVIYSISEDISNSFKIDAQTGELRTSKVLMYSQVSHYKITVVASDAGYSPLQQTAVITIQVIPRLVEKLNNRDNLRYFVVPEGLKPGNILGPISSHDHHMLARQKVHFTIVEGDDHFQFGIDSMSGELYLTQELDYETITHYLLKIIAEDSSQIPSKNTTVFVSIKVEDQNDHSPWFKDDRIVVGIQENLPAGSLVYLFNAKDADGSGPNSDLQYSIVLESSSENLFYIDPFQGCLKTVTSINREMAQTSVLIVTATDQAVDVSERKVCSLIAQIIVLDVNDNSPAFVSTNVAYVMEDEKVGYRVHHIIAQDADAGENGRVTYSVISGNEDNTFKLDESSGSLILASCLDRELQESYVLTILGQDNGLPAQSSTQMLTIVIVDVNDEVPAFQQSVYEVRISENLNEGEFVIKVEASDRDSGINAALTYEILPSAGYDLFKMNSQIGEVHTIQMLDRELQENISIKVLVRDNGVPSLSATTTIMVTVVDENDNHPEFIFPVHELRIPENQEPAVIYTAMAMDKDAGENGLVIYQILGGNLTDVFRFDAISGELSTTRGLDREEFSNISLIIEARDLGSPQQTCTAKLWIIVLDENDNSPIFERSHYRTSVKEDLPVGSSVLQLIAVDKDDGSNGDIIYSIIDDTSGMFTINSSTGLLVTTGELDRETKSQYVFRAVASDNSIQNPKSTTVNVIIHIEDVNDNFPVFVQNPVIANVTLNTMVNLTITTVRADDKDLGPNGTVIFQILESNSVFAINSNSGEIYLKTSLPHVHFSTNLLYVVARDEGVPTRSSTGLVVIYLQGEEKGIWFTHDMYEVTIAENIRPGTSVLRVAAQDYSNNASRIRYSIFKGNENGAFSIGSNTGEIVAKGSKFWDFEVRTKVHLVLLAENNHHTAHSRLTIILQDVNDNQPQFEQSHYRTSVWEGQIYNTYVMQIFASDADSGLNGQIEYSIISGNQNQAFIIDSARGILATNAILDREIISSYRLIVQAADQGNPRFSATTTILIQVVDINDNVPTIPPLKAVKIFENLPTGYVVVQIIANDMDLNTILSYNFTEAGNPGGKFSIDRYSGVITLTQPLDFEVQSEYLLRIRTSDSVHETEASLKVVVVDVNDNPPLFSQDTYQIGLLELTPMNSYVLTVSATDKDSGVNGQLSYRILLGATQGFYINSETGMIFYYATDNAVIQLLIEARDGGNPALTSITSAQIYIQDINDHIPQFTQALYNISVNEDIAPGVILLSVSASDLDWARENCYIDYTIIGGNEQNQFYIENSMSHVESHYQMIGNLVLANVLDREVMKNYTLVVRASDRETSPMNSTTVISIIVLDVNDNAPVFSSLEHHVEVAESIPLGSKLIEMLAYDHDQGVNADITYRIISGNERKHFKIDPKTGFVRSRLPLDYEEISKFILTVQAVDGGITNQKMAFSVLYIDVLNENDNIPYFAFPTLNCTVRENEPIHTSVCAVHALDHDTGIFGQLTYSILPSPSINDSMPKDEKNFGIDPLTGDIHTKEIFDFEQQKKYMFIVQAKDKGNATATITVQVDIQGIDEFEPVFTQESYYFTLSENVELGQKAGQVTAIDNDAGIDGIVEYSFLQPSPFFSVNKTSGVVYLSDAVHKIKGSYKKREEVIELVIKASSPVSHSRSAISFAAINVSRSWDVLVDEPSRNITVSLTISFVIFLLFSACLTGLICRSKRKDKKDFTFTNVISNVNCLRYLAATLAHHDVKSDYKDGKTPFDGSLEQLSLRVISKKEESFNPRNSDSSGRGSAEGENVEDEEIKMINCNQCCGDFSSVLSHEVIRVPDSGIPRESDQLLCRSSETNSTTVTFSNTENIHNFKDEGGGEGRDTNFVVEKPLSKNLKSTEIKENIVMLDANKELIFILNGQTSLNGSLTSLVSAKEELQSSYNWDYLLKWEPGFRPLASVFTEIANLKDENLQKQTLKNEPKSLIIPPPLITSVAQHGIRAVPPRLPIIRFNPSFPKYSYSPIIDSSSIIPSAMAPSFSPSISILATQTPSVSRFVSAAGLASHAIKASVHEQKIEEEIQI